jgi:F0F1-type ATP synthase membrane subunit c/vacuolar-type H+-ATPase subunit K
MNTLRWMVVVTAAAGIVIAVMAAFGLHEVFAQTAEPEVVKSETKAITEVNSRYYMAVVLGAAVAGGLGFLGGGYAVARVGAAAMGAASERPELLIRSLVFVALGEGIAIFGLVVAILLVLKLPG